MEEICFQLIVYAGNSKTFSLKAVEFAKDGLIDDALSALTNAGTELTKAHEIQTQLITDEANGKKVGSSMLMVHAQDHLTMAILSLDFAEIIVNILKK